MDQDRLVPYRSFLEWYRETDPDRYYQDETATKENPSDRKVGLKARYDEFRADYSAKQVGAQTHPFPVPATNTAIQVQILFEKHHTAAWFLEKYDPTEKYSDLRARVRKQGWHGALEHFLEELEAGKFDHIVEAAKISTANATEKAESQNGETQTTALDENSEEKKEDKSMKPEDEEDKIDDDAEWNANGDNDEVVIPHKGHQVMIKTIPPDIGRLRLEPVCTHRLQTYDPHSIPFILRS